MLAVKFNWLSQPFHVMSTCFGKISIAILILRILAPNKLRTWFLYSLIALLLIVNVVCVVFIFAQCNPPKALWRTAIHGNCWSPKVQENYSFFQGCETVHNLSSP